MARRVEYEGVGTAAEEAVANGDGSRLRTYDLMDQEYIYELLQGHLMRICVYFIVMKNSTRYV